MGEGDNWWGAAGRLVNGISSALVGTENAIASEQLREGRPGGDSNTYPLRVAKVTDVDPVRMMVSLYFLTGAGEPKDEVPLTFPNAGARHFLGSIPEINDLCVVGSSPSESNANRQPYIVGWLVPGPAAGYDWLTTAPVSTRDMDLNSPGTALATQGIMGKRRHKLRLMDAGNVFASSSQGADLLLTESATLTNRRGDELTLRDQDQALVVRSLQQFHAGAGFRIYGGAAQRDARSLPRQMWSASQDWSGPTQVSAEGEPLTRSGFPPYVQGAGTFTPADIFSSGIPVGVSIQAELSGAAISAYNTDSLTYGGKPMYRVGTQGGNALRTGENSWSEYRIEVSYENDGTLPVTEQTDGYDADRIPGGSSVPPVAASSVEFSLGTAVGNDAFGGGRPNYGKPLVPKLYTEDGTFAPSIGGAGPDDPVSSHAAVMFRVKDPTGGPEAFWAITKGGALRSYFPGLGSSTMQEYYEMGRQTRMGGTCSLDTPSYALTASGTGDGILLSADSSPVFIYGGGASTEGGANANLDGGPDESPASAQLAVNIQSGKSAAIGAVENVTLTGQNIVLKNAKSIRESASDLIEMVAGNGEVSITASTISNTTTGKRVDTYGGPKNMLPTSGAAHEISYTAMGLGGSELKRSFLLGGQSDTFNMGIWGTNFLSGSRNITCYDPISKFLPLFGPGLGFSASTGPLPVCNTVSANLIGTGLLSMVPGTMANVVSVGGPALLSGMMMASISSAAMVMTTAPFVKVNTIGLPGGVITDGCIDGLTGRPLMLAGTVGCPGFRV